MEQKVQLLTQIVDNVEKVIVGKREEIEMVLVALMCGSHVLIEDIPGTGKTSLVSALSRSIACEFSRIQFTPDILPSDITGFSVYNQKNASFEYRPGAVMSNLVLADEINRTSPKTQSSLLEVMEEKQVTVDGHTLPMANPFMVIATQNPIEYLGTFPLPEAQLDRFFIRISLGYPTAVQECEMLTRFQGRSPIETLEPVATGEQIIEIQQEVEQVFVSDLIIGYIVMIVSATRKNPLILLGASPRSSIALLKAAKAWAFYNGREYVLPDDVQKMAPYVLSHRVKLKQEAIGDNLSAVEVIQGIVAQTKVPRNEQ